MDALIPCLDKTYMKVYYEYFGRGPFAFTAVAQSM